LNSVLRVIFSVLLQKFDFVISFTWFDELPISNSDEFLTNF
jgi:hypothetical protein